MFKLIETLRAKPSDRNIRILRVLFALILLGVIYFGFSKTYFEYSAIPKEALYILYAFPLIGLVRGVLDPGIFRKKVWKWTQVGIGVFFMIFSFFLIETETRIISPVTPQNAGTEISATDLVNNQEQQKTVLDTDFWIGFLGFWIALFGLILSSKNITKKNERYGEKVTKIRV